MELLLAGGDSVELFLAGEDAGVEETVEDRVEQGPCRPAAAGVKEF